MHSRIYCAETTSKGGPGGLEDGGCRRLSKSTFEVVSVYVRLLCWGTLLFACATLRAEPGGCKDLRSPPAEGAAESKPSDPLFSGSLLADSGQNYRPGEWNLNPVIYCINNYGLADASWDNHNIPDLLNIVNQLRLQTGLTRALDLTVVARYVINRSQGSSSHGWGDFIARAGLQILEAEPGTTDLNVRLTLREIFPSGKYERLSPRHRLIDRKGWGSYQTVVNLIFSKISYYFPCHPMEFTVNMGGIISSPVSVHGFHSYGGGYGTKGRIKPGESLFFDYGVEVKLAKYVGLTLDVFLQYGAKSKFKGRSGFNADGTPATNGSLEAMQISMAPGVEYFFTKNLYLIAGAWVSVASKNDYNFVSGILNLIYDF